MIRRFFYLLLVTVMIGGLGGAVAGYAFDFKPKFLAEVILGSPQPPQTISAEAARSDVWQPQIAAIGTLAAQDGIDVTPQAGGVVKELYFDSGDAVKAGDRLVQLDTATEEADLRNFRVQLANAETELGRKQAVFDKGYLSKAELDDVRTRRDQLLANIDRVEALIEQKSIHAPWAGRLGLRSVSVGSYVAAGDKLVWLQNTDPIFADFTVTEQDFGRIRDGLPVTARFDAWPGETFAGEIATTDARMSGESRMITVRARLANPEGKLLPGMYANVLVDSGAPIQVTTVPQTAVTYSLYGDSVFVVVPATKLDPNAKPEELAIERRFVKAGNVRDGRVEVVEGVAPGDQVVTAGHNKIDQGTKVVIDNSVALRALESNTIQ